MKASDWNRLVETAARRSLTEAERLTLEELLRRQPSLRDQWATEERLNACLDRLPPAPVASNFTSRVLQAIAVIEPVGPRWWHRLPVPAITRRPAMAMAWAGAAAIVLAGVLLHLQQREAARAQLAASVATMARGVSTPVRATEVPELWLDFDPIRLMSQAQPVVDEELLAALK